jgi:hypothetical protein
MGPGGLKIRTVKTKNFVALRFQANAVRSWASLRFNERIRIQENTKETGRFDGTLKSSYLGGLEQCAEY